KVTSALTTIWRQASVPASSDASNANGRTRRAGSRANRNCAPGGLRGDAPETPLVVPPSASAGDGGAAAVALEAGCRRSRDPGGRTAGWMSGPAPARHAARPGVARGDVVKVGGYHALGHQLDARAAPGGERDPARARARAYLIDGGHAASCSKSR